jgi:hypothetical protein
MTTKEILKKEIDTAPDEILQEVLDFFRFLKNKQKNKMRETMLISEPILRKEWFLPEEDEAWKDL